MFNQYKVTSTDTQNHARRRAVRRYGRRHRRALSLRKDKKPILMEIEMLSTFRKLMKDEGAATAIEYVLIASLISVAAIAAMTSVGGKVSNVLSNVASAMK
jgi:pilus assembly protein Flp/PilA